MSRLLKLCNTVQAGLKAGQAQFNAGAKHNKEWDDAHGGWRFRQADSINRAAAEVGSRMAISEKIRGT